MRWLRAALYITLPLCSHANLAALKINEELQAQKSLRTVPCEQLSIFSLRTTLSGLLAAKKSERVSTYPLYQSESDMRKEWAALPGVKPGDNPESTLLKFAHCHQAVMWFTKHLSLAEQAEFSSKEFLPLLPTKQLSVDGFGALSTFYKSVVTCSQCFPVVGNNTSREVEHVNQQLQARKDLRVTPCEQLSIFSLRMVLKDLLSAKKSKRTAEYPMYGSEAEMKLQWSALPGVQPGDNDESRLVKFAHCHEAVMWFQQHLDKDEQAIFAQRSFLPLLPMTELQLVGPSALTEFYAAKVKCAQCGIYPMSSSPIEFTV